MLLGRFWGHKGALMFTFGTNQAWGDFALFLFRLKEQIWLNNADVHFMQLENRSHFYGRTFMSSSGYIFIAGFHLFY